MYVAVSDLSEASIQHSARQDRCFVGGLGKHRFCIAGHRVEYAFNKICAAIVQALI